MKPLIIAIDGFSSCGKSTIAKQLAQYAGYRYIDTGAMYRSVALYTLRNAGEVAPEEWLPAHISEIQISFARMSDGSQHTLLNGEDVEHLIRTLEVGNKASQVSALPFVREAMVAQQQAMGSEGGIVMDGRDIGTVVFPGAELKLFLTASAEVRAQRRYDELVGKGETPEYEAVLADVNDRDYRDTHRAIAPLRPAEDAIIIDNSDLTREEQMVKIYAIFDDALTRARA